MNELEIIANYFEAGTSNDSAPCYINCEYNPKLNIEIGLWNDEPTIYFSNAEGYHCHFDDVPSLLKECRAIFAETVVFEMNEQMNICHMINLYDVNDRTLYEELFTQPINRFSPELYRPIEFINVLSWRGTHSGIIRIGDLDGFFKDTLLP